MVPEEGGTVIYIQREVEPAGGRDRFPLGECGSVRVGISRHGVRQGSLPETPRLPVFLEGVDVVENRVGLGHLAQTPVSRGHSQGSFQPDGFLGGIRGVAGDSGGGTGDPLGVLKRGLDVLHRLRRLGGFADGPEKEGTPRIGIEGRRGVVRSPKEMSALSVGHPEVR